MFEHIPQTNQAVLFGENKQPLLIMQVDSNNVVEIAVRNALKIDDAGCHQFLDSVEQIFGTPKISLVSRKIPVAAYKSYEQLQNVLEQRPHNKSW